MPGTMGDGEQQAQLRTRIRVSRARTLMSQSYSPHDIIETLMSEYDVSRRSAHRSTKVAEELEGLQAEKGRRARLGRQIAKLERAQRLALETVRCYAHQGSVVEEKAAPDLSAFITSVVEQNRLLGLHLPTVEQLQEDGARVGQLVVIQRTAAEEGSDSSTDPSTPSPGPDMSNGHEPRAALPSPFLRRNGHS